jgi:hypothetical protein
MDPQSRKLTRLRLQLAFLALLFALLLLLRA